MKKIIISAFVVFITNFASAQETEFKCTKDGFTDYVVGIVEGKTASELYKKTIDWVSVTFKNPKEVTKATIENDYVRIEAVTKAMFVKNVLLSKFYEDGKYQIEISLKDGKYKFDVIELQNYVEASQYNAGKWYSIDLSNLGLFKENGDVKGQFKAWPSAIEKTFNELNIDLKKYLSGETGSSKKKDW